MNNKWVVLIITLAVIFGLLIITNAHFQISAGMGQKTFSIGIQ